MRQAEHEAEAFEQVLLSHVEMCYSVALALTRNPNRAQDLARHALTGAWCLRTSADGEKDIKNKLLKALREEFLQHYCNVSSTPRDEATLPETGKYVLPEVQKGISRRSHAVFGMRRRACR